ncbi:MAG: hypothetical protein M5U34_30670 [Chloroflexi bacterium]|nr:hypothetical protein [Chloroflexota bacterium]
MNEEKYPSSDEKTMAGLANGAVILPMWGLIVAVLIRSGNGKNLNLCGSRVCRPSPGKGAQIAVMFGGIILYMGSFFLMMGGMFMVDPTGAEPPFFSFSLPDDGLSFPVSVRVYHRWHLGWRPFLSKGMTFPIHSLGPGCAAI